MAPGLGVPGWCANTLPFCYTLVNPPIQTFSSGGWLGPPPRSVLGLGTHSYLGASKPMRRRNGVHPMTITAVIHEAEEGGYWAEVPSLPGCVTEGETVEEAKAALTEAVQGWMAVAHDIAIETAAKDTPYGRHHSAQLVELTV